MNTDKIKVIYHNNLIPNFPGNIRRPFFMIRGKQVTSEQAMDIISKTDYTFAWHDNMLDGNFNFKNAIQNIANCCWFNLGSDWSTGIGWCYPTGDLYTNDCTDVKYVDFDGFLGEAYELKENFPFLDMIMVVTDWNEMPDEIFYNKEGVDYYKLYRKHFQFLIHLVNEEIHVYTREYALEKYIEYIKELGMRDIEIMSNQPNLSNKELKDKVEYFKECVRRHQLDGEDIYKRLVGTTIFLETNK